MDCDDRHLRVTFSRPTPKNSETFHANLVDEHSGRFSPNYLFKYLVWKRNRIAMQQVSTSECINRRMQMRLLGESISSSGNALNK